MNALSSLGVILVPVALLAFAQVLLKWRASALGALGLDEFGFLRAIGLSYSFWLAMVLAGGSLIVWLLILRRYPLSFAYPFVSLTFPFVTLLGALILAERVSAQQVLGMVLIVMGVVLNARGGE